MWQNLDCLLTAKKKNASFAFECSILFSSVFERKMRIGPNQNWLLVHFRIVFQLFCLYFGTNEVWQIGDFFYWILTLASAPQKMRDSKVQHEFELIPLGLIINYDFRFLVLYSKVPIISCTLFQFQTKVWLKSVTPFPTKMNDRVKKNGPANATQKSPYFWWCGGHN